MPKWAWAAIAVAVLVAGIASMIYIQNQAWGG